MAVWETFDLTENEHRDHILKISRVPANVPESLANEAREIAAAIASAFDYVGVLAVEMFVVREAAGPALLVNEIAPRVHNSGHWTIDGAASRSSSNTSGRSPAGRWRGPCAAGALK